MADVHMAERILREAESTFNWPPYFLKDQQGEMATSSLISIGIHQMLDGAAHLAGVKIPRKVDEVTLEPELNIFPSNPICPISIAPSWLQAISLADPLPYEADPLVLSNGPTVCEVPFPTIPAGGDRDKRCHRCHTVPRVVV